MAASSAPPLVVVVEEEEVGYVSVGASLDLAMQRGGKVPEGRVESQQVRLASQLWTSQWASQRELKERALAHSVHDGSSFACSCQASVGDKHSA